MPPMPETQQSEQLTAKHTCPECSREFRTPQGLSGHMRLIHRARPATPAEPQEDTQEDPEPEEDPQPELEPAPTLPKPRPRPTKTFQYEEDEPVRRRARRHGFHFGPFHL